MARIAYKALQKAPRLIWWGAVKLFKRQILLAPTPTSVPAVVGENYQNLWKLRLLTQALWIVAVGSIVMVGLWLSRAGRLDVGGTLGVVMLFANLAVLSKRFSWQVKGVVLITELTIVGMYFPLLIGLRYTALSIAGAGVMVSAAFFNRRSAFALIAIDAALILLYGHLAQTGRIYPPTAPLADETIFFAWLKSAIVFVTVGSMLTVLIGGLVDSLESGAMRLRRLSDIAAASELKYRQLVDSAPEAIVLLDIESGRFIDVNPQAERLLGYTAQELLQIGPIDLSPQKQENGRDSAELAREYIASAIAGETPVFEWLHHDRDGVLLPCEVRLQRLETADGIFIRGTMIDIRERRKAQAIIQSLALYDNLTGLPNRKLFQDRLRHAIATSERDHKYSALFFIDVDNFKNINDSSGHASGDYLLTVVAERITACVGEGDTVARWGGDEFVVIAENLSESLTQAGKSAELIGEKILSALRDPIENPHQRGQFFQNTVSIGMTLLYGHIHTPEELLKRADIAMYQAKLAGKNRQRNFDVDMQKQVEERLALEGDLRRAVQKSQFVLHLQAQYNNDRRIFGAEVLVRWLHPQRGLILPGEFIAVAEETGDIVEIGKWIIETACRQLKSWQGNEKFRNLVLAINVSPRQFHDQSFVDFVSEAITRWQIDPTLLKLEITESLMLDNIEVALEKMAMLRESGVSFSLDDFGTGYSSLSYLKRLPLSQLKIDQSFVRDVAREKNDATLVRTIIGMAENLNLSVIAEGVEDEAQLHLLAKMGCHAYQGYFFSRPVALTEFEQLFV